MMPFEKLYNLSTIMSNKATKMHVYKFLIEYKERLETRITV